MNWPFYLTIYLLLALANVPGVQAQRVFSGFCCGFCVALAFMTVLEAVA